LSVIWLWQCRSRSQAECVGAGCHLLTTTSATTLPVAEDGRRNSRNNSLNKKPDNLSVSWHLLAEMLDDRDGRFKHDRSLSASRKVKVFDHSLFLSSSVGNNEHTLELNATILALVRHTVSEAGRNSYVAAPSSTMDTSSRLAICSRTAFHRLCQRQTHR
jgi:hypothetical protein